eukprot:6490246-Amphidinium_carterae.3
MQTVAVIVPEPPVTGNQRTCQPPACQSPSGRRWLRADDCLGQLTVLGPERPRRRQSNVRHQFHLRICGDAFWGVGIRQQAQCQDPLQLAVGTQVRHACENADTPCDLLLPRRRPQRSPSLELPARVYAAKTGLVCAPDRVLRPRSHKHTPCGPPSVHGSL